MGDNEQKAFDYLDKTLEEGSHGWEMTLKYFPEWDLLRSDTGFKKVVERLNFPR